MKIYFLKGNPLFPLVKFYCLCLYKHARTPWVLQRLLQSQCTEPLPQTSNAIQVICPRTLLSHKNDTSWREVYFISCNKIKRDKFIYTSKSQNLRFKGKKILFKLLFVSATSVEENLDSPSRQFESKLCSSTQKEHQLKSICIRQVENS